MNDGRRKDKDDDEAYFDEAPENRGISAISFARSSNILSNKYGLPVADSTVSSQDEEDPFDLYMK